MSKAIPIRLDDNYQLMLSHIKQATGIKTTAGVFKAALKEMAKKHPTKAKIIAEDKPLPALKDTIQIRLKTQLERNKMTKWMEQYKPMGQNEIARHMLFERYAPRPVEKPQTSSKIVGLVQLLNEAKMDIEVIASPITMNLIEEVQKTLKSLYEDNQ